MERFIDLIISKFIHFNITSSFTKKYEILFIGQRFKSKL